MSNYVNVLTLVGRPRVRILDNDTPILYHLYLDNNTRSLFITAPHVMRLRSSLIAPISNVILLLVEPSDTV